MLEIEMILHFFGLLEKKLKDLGGYPIIIGSDFNEVMDPILDCSSPLAHTTKAHAVLKDMSASGLVDIWRLQNPSSRDFTFFSSPHSSFSRIDLFWCLIRWYQLWERVTLVI